MLGSPSSRRKTAGHLAVAASASVLVPNDHLAPEHPFPAALDDALRAYEWVLAHASQSFGIVIAGDSSGGGLAVATALAARDRGLLKPAGIVGLSPWADLTCTGKSMATRSANDLECTPNALLQMAQWYLGRADPCQPLASPVFADLTGQPPILCLVGSDDVLLDDSVRLVYNAAIAGADATLFIGAGMQHVFPIWVGAFPEANPAIALIGEWAQAREEQPREGTQI